MATGLHESKWTSGRGQNSNSDLATFFDSRQKAKKILPINIDVDEDPWSDEEVGKLGFML
jgi:hypothetical protein